MTKVERANDEGMTKHKGPMGAWREAAPSALCELLMRHHRLQYSLREVFIAAAVLSVILALGRTFGWHALYLADIAGLLLLTALPYVLALRSLILRTGINPTHVEQAVLAAGILLAIHLAATTAAVEAMIRTPWTVDPHPYDSFIIDTLNVTLPSVVVGIAAGVSFARRLWCSPTFVVGIVLFAGAALGFVWYGSHFFGLTGDSLGEHIWWIW
ncbi:MAG: hypothetical protein ABFD16_23660 [Thermoguttaceae bacterium]|jgi:hypothetical protein